MVKAAALRGKEKAGKTKRGGEDALWFVAILFRPAQHAPDEEQAGEEAERAGKGDVEIRCRRHLEAQHQRGTQEQRGRQNAVGQQGDRRFQATVLQVELETAAFDA